MSTRAWQDRIVGDRMTVDQEFTDTVESSQFSRQQWGLIMTAVEFDIENPESESAALVADTEKLPHVMDELDDIDARTPMAASDDSGGGILDSISGLFGGGGDDHDEQLAAAERLADRYAEQLQTHLEEQGKWDEIRAAARN
ncbi:hypothetical protein C448_11051 [Halococcus morrhuae DSM 1307]|jgi:hypothetical protein|uniref:Uncharacterized protein n=1 Tax=Halococcus morrhuae DSM 1307 TaxID=931277 RepID=M0MC77_HALMO|nr:DUF5799 family protein [Halococcus morrhuae]EMA42269.1 hypothetical protein C448_11051 [Halococcus morrhuae DSM 1307]